MSNNLPYGLHIYFLVEDFPESSVSHEIKAGNNDGHHKETKDFQSIINCSVLSTYETNAKKGEKKHVNYEFDNPLLKSTYK